MDETIYSRLDDLERRLLRTEAADMPTWPGGNVYRTTSQSIPNATATAVVFDAVRQDDVAYWSAANPTRLTAPATGQYLIGAGARFAFSGVGVRQVAIQIGGSTPIALWSDQAPSNADPMIVLTRWYPLVAGEFVELTVFQTSGGALNLIAAANYSPEFWIQRVG